MNYVLCLEKYHMENDETFLCLRGKMLLCFWKYSVWLAVTKRSEDTSNTKCCVCACFRDQEQLQVPLKASASLNTCNLLSKILNELKKALLTSGGMDFILCVTQYLFTYREVKRYVQSDLYSTYFHIFQAFPKALPFPMLYTQEHKQHHSWTF